MLIPATGVTVVDHRTLHPGSLLHPADKRLAELIEATSATARSLATRRRQHGSRVTGGQQEDDLLHMEVFFLLTLQ